MPLTPIPGVPRPDIIRPTAEERKYPLATMAVDDMFFVEGVMPASLAAHVSHRSTVLGRKFRTQQVYMRRDRRGVWKLCRPDDKGAMLGVGVWRVS